MDSDASDDVAERRRWVDQQVEGSSRPRWRRGLESSSDRDDRSPPHSQRHRTWSSHALHRFGDWSANAAAGLTVAGLVAAWMIVGIATGFPHWWETVLYSASASVTVVMVFAIQHTQSRQQRVTQRKLDELLRAQPSADDRLIAAEDASDEELTALGDLNTADREAFPTTLRRTDGRRHPP